MKILISENQLKKIISESLPISVAKEYSSIPRDENAQKYINQFFDNLLKNNPNSFASKRKERIYIPFKSTPLSLEIDKELEKNNFKLSDYSKGIAKDKYDREINIGKVLNKIGRNDLLNKFNIDNSRKSESINVSQYIVISRHPYDLAGMSTDRDWTSCMNLNVGSNRHYVKCDIEHGTLIAYLINKNDLNINKPIGRILLKPYESNKDIVYGVSKQYGNVPLDFKKTIEKILEKSNVGTSFSYSRNKNLYDDGESEMIMTQNFELTNEVIENLDSDTIDLLLKYSRDPNKIINILISNQKFIENLELPVMTQLLRYSKEPYKIINILISNPKFFKKLDLPVMDQILRYSRVPDKIINILISNPKFFENLKSDGIKYLLSYSQEPDKIVNILGDKGRNYIENLGSDEITFLLNKSQEPGKIVNILGDKGRNYIESLSSYGIVLLLRYSREPNKIINTLISNQNFIENLDPYGIDHLLKYSRDPNKIINILMSNEKFIENLDPDGIYNLLSNSQELGKIKMILKKFGKQIPWE